MLLLSRTKYAKTAFHLSKAGIRYLKGFPQGAKKFLSSPLHRKVIYKSRNIIKKNTYKVDFHDELDYKIEKM